MNTDQQILAIVERGFTLPEGISTIELDGGPRLTNRAVLCEHEDWRRQQAVDLCAMHFARQAKYDWQTGEGWTPPNPDWNFSDGWDRSELDRALRDGDSAAAIAALHAALEAQHG